MALKRYDELATGAAKAVARAWWRTIYANEIPMENADGSITWTDVTAAMPDNVVEADIIADMQGIGFLWNDDGTPAF